MDLSTSKDGAGIREGWPIILACFLTIFTAYTTAFILGPMLDVMGRDLGLSLTAMGQLAAIIFIPGEWAHPFWRPFSDRYGRKPRHPHRVDGSLALQHRHLIHGRLSCGGGLPVHRWTKRRARATHGGSVDRDNFTGRARGFAIGFSTAGVAMGCSSESRAWPF